MDQIWPNLPQSISKLTIFQFIWMEGNVLFPREDGKTCRQVSLYKYNEDSNLFKPEVPMTGRATRGIQDCTQKHVDTVLKNILNNYIGALFCHIHVFTSFFMRYIFKYVHSKSTKGVPSFTWDFIGKVFKRITRLHAEIEVCSSTLQ